MSYFFSSKVSIWFSFYSFHYSEDFLLVFIYNDHVLLYVIDIFIIPTLKPLPTNYNICVILKSVTICYLSFSNCSHFPISFHVYSALHIFNDTFICKDRDSGYFGSSLITVDFCSSSNLILSVFLDSNPNLYLPWN